MNAVFKETPPNRSCTGSFNYQTLNIYGLNISSLEGRRVVCVSCWLTLGLYWSLGLMLHFTRTLPPSVRKHICPTSIQCTVFYYACTPAAHSVFRRSNNAHAPVLWMPYLTNSLKEVLQLCLKHSLGLKIEEIRFCRSDQNFTCGRNISWILVCTHQRHIALLPCGSVM